MEDINYKELLYHYMEHVINCESISFVEKDYFGVSSSITDTEREQLLVIQKEVLDKMYK